MLSPFTKLETVQVWVFGRGLTRRVCSGAAFVARVCFVVIALSLFSSLHQLGRSFGSCARMRRVVSVSRLFRARSALALRMRSNAGATVCLWKLKPQVFGCGCFVGSTLNIEQCLHRLSVWLLQFLTWPKILLSMCFMSLFYRPSVW